VLGIDGPEHRSPPTTRPPDPAPGRGGPAEPLLLTLCNLAAQGRRAGPGRAGAQAHDAEIAATPTGVPGAPEALRCSSPWTGQGPGAGPARLDRRGRPGHRGGWPWLCVGRTGKLPRPSSSSRRSGPTTTRPLEYRTLADWHMALNHRDQYEQARIESTRWRRDQIGNMLSQKLQPWQRSDAPLPNELDKEVLLMLAALFEKSAHPQNYLWAVQQYYALARLPAAGEHGRRGRPGTRRARSIPSCRDRAGSSRRSATRRPPTRSSSAWQDPPAGRRPTSTAARSICWRRWSSAARRS